MGISSQFGTGLGLLAVLGGDLVAVLFFCHLWKRYRVSNEPVGTGKGGMPPPRTLLFHRVRLGKLLPQMGTRKTERWDGVSILTT